MRSLAKRNRKEVWDQTPWEPTAWQQTLLGLGFSWIAAIVVEYFVLERADAWSFLKELFLSVFFLRFGADFWAGLFWWIVLPAAVFYAPMALVKKSRRYVLLVCTVVFTAILVLIKVSA
jgi:hypothetical protein